MTLINRDRKKLIFNRSTFICKQCLSIPTRIFAGSMGKLYEKVKIWLYLYQQSVIVADALFPSSSSSLTLLNHGVRTETYPMSQGNNFCNYDGDRRTPLIIPLYTGVL
jgi:hypothetical protein